MNENWNEYSFFYLLDNLHVKYTKKYARKVFLENFIHNDLYGISSMLRDYNIENVGIEVDNKAEDIHLLPSSFIAVCKSGFFYVKKVTRESVLLYLNKKLIKVALKSFTVDWTGIALLFEATSATIEKNYEENKQNVAISIVLRSFFLVFVSVIILFLIIRNKLEYSNITLIILMINLFGIYVSTLLLLKQMKISNSVANKVCSLFENLDCGSISTVKLFGRFSLSELGLAYFLPNFVIVLFFPESIPSFSIFTVCSLPFTIWSLWYQKHIAKHWCLLCLIVQVLLWILFIVYFIFNVIDFNNFISFQFVFIGSVYITSLILINVISKNIEELYQLRQDLLLFNDLKKNDIVFQNLIKQQRYVSVNKSISSVFLGERQSKHMIVIVANPLCKPCALLHKQVIELLESVENKVCIQYIFISHDQQAKYTRLLIEQCQKADTAKDLKIIISAWFSEIADVENIILEYDKLFNPSVTCEFISHKMWAEKNEITSTPTLLFDGYTLPVYYSISDLKYLLI